MKFIQRLIDGADNYQKKHRLSGFSYAVIKKYGEDNAGQRAALLTYYGFLALFPLLMIATTVVNSFARSRPGFEETVVNAVKSYFPVLGDQLSGHIHGLHSTGPALLVGLLFTLYGTRGVAVVFRSGIRKIWGEKRDEGGFPIKELRSIALVVVGGLGFLAAAIISATVAAAGHGWSVKALSIGVNLLLLFLLFNFLLNMCLPRHISFKETRVGAATAAVGLVALQAAGIYLIGKQLKHLDALYSYFAVTLALLFWIYLQAQMLFYSAEIAVVSSRKLWPRGFNEKSAD